MKSRESWRICCRRRRIREEAASGKEKKCRAELNRLRTMQKAVYEDYRKVC